MSTFNKTTLMAGIALSLGLASLTARADFAEFTIDETLLGVGTHVVEGDKLNGGYEEVITFTPTGPTTANFDTVAFATFGQLFENEGADLVLSGLGSEYVMYAIFESSGSVANTTTLPVFTGATGSFTLYLDPNLDSDGTLPGTGSGSVTVSNNSDDILIATSTSLTAGTGVLVPGVGGFFDLLFDDFTLTADGANYFVAPVPFYFITNVDGDFDTFAVAGTQNLTGDVSAVFQAVPEPGTLSLVGMSLLGLASARRRKQA